MGYRRFGLSKTDVPKRLFHYVQEADMFACPMGCVLSYATTSREGERLYKSNPSDWSVCLMREGCFSAKRNKRTKERQRLYRLRWMTIERSFADAQELNGYRYDKYRGLKSVQMQAYLTTACQNMKKIAHHLTKKGQMVGDFLGKRDFFDEGYASFFVFETKKAQIDENLEGFSSI